MNVTQEQASQILDGKICAYCRDSFIEGHGYAVLCTSCFPKDEDDLPIHIHEKEKEEKK